MFNCDHCHLAFATIWDLNIHVRFCHVDPSFWQPGKNPMDQSGKYPTGMAPFPGPDMSQGIPLQRDIYSGKDPHMEEEKNYYGMLPDHLREAQAALYGKQTKPKDYMASQLYDQSKDRLASQLYDQSKDRLASQLYDQSKDRLASQLYDQSKDRLASQLYDQTKDRLASPLYDQTKDRLASQLYDQTKDRLASPLYDQTKDRLVSQLYDQSKDRLASQLYDQTKDRLTSPLYDQSKDRLASLAHPNTTSSFSPRVSQYSEPPKERLPSLMPTDTSALFNPRVSQYNDPTKDRLSSLGHQSHASGLYSPRPGQYTTNELPKDSRLPSLSPTDSSGMFNPRPNQQLGHYSRPEDTGQAFDYSSTRPASTSSNMGYAPPSSDVYRAMPMNLQYGFNETVDHMGGAGKLQEDTYIPKSKHQDLDINSIFRMASDFSKGVKSKAVSETIENFVNQSHKHKPVPEMVDNYMNQSHKNKLIPETMDSFVNQSEKSSKPILDTMGSSMNQSHHKPLNGSDNFSTTSKGKGIKGESVLENGGFNLNPPKKLNDSEEWAIMNSLNSVGPTTKVKRKGRKPKEPIICRFCGVEFIKKADLAAHVIVHSDEFTFNCIMCGEVFETSAQLRKHRRTHRPPNDTEHYECMLCGLLLKNWPRVESHVRSHTGARPFKCDICGNDFAAQYSLKKHMRIHSGVKPYECEMCPLKFTDRHNLQTHIRKHTGEKPFDCDVCGVKFTLKNSLRVHSMMHRGEVPYTCDVCYKPFYRKQHFRSHQRVHTGEKPYVCNICDKGFSRNHHLTIHTRIHTGERPYKCEKCDESFIRKSHLDTHLKHHALGVELYTTKSGLKKIKTVRVCKSKRYIARKNRMLLRKAAIEAAAKEGIIIEGKRRYTKSKTKKKLKKECLKGTRISKRLFTRKKKEEENTEVKIKVEEEEEEEDEAGPPEPPPVKPPRETSSSGRRRKRKFDADKCYEENINKYIQRLMAERGELLVKRNMDCLRDIEKQRRDRASEPGKNADEKVKEEGETNDSSSKEDDGGDDDGGDNGVDTIDKKGDTDQSEEKDKPIEKQIEDRLEEFSAAINLIRKVKS